MGNEIILLAMPGTPPSDFPSPELAELFCMRARSELSNGPERALYECRCSELEAKLRAWPRTPQNDPFHAASLALAKYLSLSTGQEVVPGFIEFANPDLDAAFEQAVRPGIERVIVVTPMMTSGEEHSEKNIPGAIGRARQRFPDVEITYAWPFDMHQVAQFLATHLAQLSVPEVNHAT